MITAKRGKKSGSKSGGFTIIELLVTISVVGLLVVGVTSLFITIETTQRKTRLLETATRSAEKKVEELRNAHYNSLEAGTSIDFESELPSILPSPRTATVDVTEDTPGIKRVDVNITYKDGPNNRQVELSSLIGVIGIGQ